MKKKRLGKGMTINAQIVLSFSVLLAAIMACIILAVVLQFSSRLIKQKTEIMHSTMETVSSSIDSNINQLRKLAISLRQDDNVTDALQTKRMTARVQATFDTLYIYGLQSSVLITEDGRPLNTPLIGPDAAENMLQMVGYDSFRASGSEEHFSPPHLFPYETSLSPVNNTKISYFFTLREQQAMQPYGTVLFIMNKDSLFTNRTQLIRSQFDHYYIIDGSGNVIYSITDYEPCEALDYAIRLSDGRYDSFDTQMNTNAYFHFSVQSYPDWHAVGVASIRSIKSNARLLTLFVVALGFCGVLMVAVLSQLISKRITGPFKQMGDAMKQFEAGNLPEKLSDNRSGEIGELLYGFNNMLDSIESNISTIFREQEEKRTAKVTAIQYQLQSLQQQINPHFLYNTLNVINYLAMQQQTDEIRSFVQSLNQLLRATLSDSSDTVTFQEEMALLRAYAQLMEYRYKDMFQLEFEVEARALDCIVPKLILQPLVENALLHGIFPSGRMGTISVRACCVDGRLCVSVADDGVGIPREKMFTLLKEKSGFSSIGLSNVNDRIKLCYSDNTGLMISSKPNAGTIVAFYIPIQKEDEDTL